MLGPGSHPLQGRPGPQGGFPGKLYPSVGKGLGKETQGLEWELWGWCCPGGSFAQRFCSVVASRSGLGCCTACGFSVSASDPRAS